jgi:DNA-binding HxlR family transcriptional regulator
MTMTTPECGLDVSLAVMGGKWKPLILFHLRYGPKRFGDLKRLVAGISEKVLIQQLREFVAAEVVVRRDYQQVPPKVDYTLTPLGETLAKALMPLCEWGTRHRTHFGATQEMPALSAAPSTELADIELVNGAQSLET